jgi:hypothetical protein
MLVGWYTVPAMATLPPLVVFMPSIVAGVGLLFVIAMFVLAFIAAMVTSR